MCASALARGSTAVQGTPLVWIEKVVVVATAVGQSQAAQSLSQAGKKQQQQQQQQQIGPLCWEAHYRGWVGGEGHIGEPPPVQDVNSKHFNSQAGGGATGGAYTQSGTADVCLTAGDIIHSSAAAGSNKNALGGYGSGKEDHGGGGGGGGTSQKGVTGELAALNPSHPRGVNLQPDPLAWEEWDMLVREMCSSE